MYAQQTSYFSSKLEARPKPQKGGYGVYARQTVFAGELLVVWGGEVVTGQELAALPKRAQHHSLQVDENFFLVPTRLPEAADYVNHSCNPNAGLSGQISLVALANIEPGDEVCFDYAMSDGNPYDEFICACEAPNCRKYVSGNDWAIPELWERYNGHFSPYLQRRIDQLRIGTIYSTVQPGTPQAPNGNGTEAVKANIV